MNALTKLKAKYDEYSRKRWPNVPDYARTYPPHFSKSNSTNGLTACVITYIELLGWTAERTGNEGRVIDNTKTHVDVLGRVRQTGSVDRIKSSGKKGTSDIKAVIGGRFVAIEIKNENTRDRMSANQIAYRDQVIRSGGIYKIMTNLDEAIEWLNQFGENQLNYNI
jgi:hypothetical protein